MNHLINMFQSVVIRFIPLYNEMHGYFVQNDIHKSDVKGTIAIICLN